MTRFLLALVLLLGLIAGANAHPFAFRRTPFNPLRGPVPVAPRGFVPSHDFSRGFVPSYGFNGARGFGTRTFVDRFGRIVTVDQFGRVIAIR